MRAVEGVVAPVADPGPRAAVVGAETGGPHAVEVAGDEEPVPVPGQERDVLAQMGQVADVAPVPSVARRRDGVDSVTRVREVAAETLGICKAGVQSADDVRRQAPRACRRTST